jgi:phosphatidylserine synthase
MTTTQMLVLVAIIYIAPHVPTYLGVFMGLVSIIFASCIGLGML